MVISRFSPALVLHDIKYCSSSLLFSILLCWNISVVLPGSESVMELYSENKAGSRHPHNYICDVLMAWKKHPKRLIQLFQTIRLELKKHIVTDFSQVKQESIILHKKIPNVRMILWIFPHWKSMKNITICTKIFLSACYDYIIKQRRRKRKR